MKIRILKECTYDVVESLDVDGEVGDSTRETLNKDEILDVDVFGETDTTVDIQFGDGSVIVGFSRDDFEEVDPEAEAAEEERDRRRGLYGAEYEGELS